jgi:hypothetical protein
MGFWINVDDPSQGMASGDFFAIPHEIMGAYVSSDATGWDDPRWAAVRERYDDWPFTDGDSPTSIGMGNSDGALAEMAEVAGYDGPPRRMTAAEMDNLPEGWVRVWRGVDNAEQAIQFRTGDYWAGKGAFGNGTYFTDMKLEADAYAGDDGVVIEAVIPADALISDHATMENIAVDARRSALDAAMPEELRGDRYRVEQNSWRFDESQAGRHGSRLLSDPGRTAVSRGVDGYKQGGGFGQGGGTFYVIQNRTAVFVSDFPEGRQPRYRRGDRRAHSVQARGRRGDQLREVERRRQLLRDGALPHHPVAEVRDVQGHP